MDRPPPYFPQNSLSPKDNRRYLKFKLIVALLGIVGLALVGGLVVGVYYLVTWLSA